MDSTVHIIIAEDNDAVRGLIARITSRVFPHAEISVAADGDDALAIYLQRGADMLLTDLMMPRLNGIDLVAELRALGAVLPVVLISAVKPTHAELQDLGSICYIAKPFDIRKVETILAGLLDPPLEDASLAAEAVGKDRSGMPEPASYSPTALADGTLMAALTVPSSLLLSSGPTSSSQL